MVNTEKIIEFECSYKTAKFIGYCIAEYLDDDDHGVRFYDVQLDGQTLHNAHIFECTLEDRKKLYQAFTSDFLFVQFLSDFKDESKVIQRPGYLLKIN